jgi:hypothetical protein
MQTGRIRIGASDAGTDSAYDDDGRGFRSCTKHAHTHAYTHTHTHTTHTHTHTLATDFTAEAAKYILYSYFLLILVHSFL